ncbi:MAG: hypothetical protein CUN55_07875 [Phototrophicales bacterium]|nr:MAG: hypothetical protein CUN55_07875 [Phototrophicales bacterium]
MNLNEYRWSLNPRGMHSALNYLNIELLSRHRFGWAKIVALSDGEIALAENAMRENITPIIRIYRERPGNAPVDSLALQQYQQYRDAGVRWFEHYNEPNLDIEWPSGANKNPNDRAVVGPLMDNWLAWAEFIISIGGYPAFPSLADVNDGTHLDTISWIRGMLNYLFDVHYERFRTVLNNGAYIAVHPYIANHFYQEMPNGGPTSARPPHLQNADEGGWHFEYPYDPINQADDPGRTVYGGTPLAPFGDTVSLLGSTTVIHDLLREMFGVGAIPFVGTEGGIPPPVGLEDVRQQDNRYPPYTWYSHAEATAAMFDWIATTAPPWFFGVCLWKFDEYYLTASGELPVGTRLAQKPPMIKPVPALPALGDIDAVVFETPVADPDHHFVFLVPNFETAWFFQQAETYWDTFKPSLLSDLEFLGNIPPEKTVAVTAITGPDMVDWLTENISERWPHIRLDVIIVDQPQALGQQLAQRVLIGRRLG